MTEHAFVYDWQSEPDGFKKWLLPTVLGDVIQDDAVFDDLRTRTDDWRNVRFVVVVNGIEVDAERFLNVLERTIEWSAEKAARRRVDAIRDLTALREVVDRVTAQLEDAVSTVAAEHGIELRDDR